MYDRLPGQPSLGTHQSSRKEWGSRMQEENKQDWGIADRKLDKRKGGEKEVCGTP